MNIRNNDTPPSFVTIIEISPVRRIYITKSVDHDSNPPRWEDAVIDLDTPRSMTAIQAVEFNIGLQKAIEIAVEYDRLMQAGKAW